MQGFMLNALIFVKYNIEWELRHKKESDQKNV